MFIQLSCAFIGVVAICAQSHEQYPAISSDSCLEPTCIAPDSRAAVVFSHPRWRAQAGVSSLFIVPNFESNPSYLSTTIQSQGLAAPTRATRQQQEFDYDLSWSPRLHLSLQNDKGIGVRARWWAYDEAAVSIQATNDPIPLGSPVLARTIEGASPLLSSGPQTGLPAVFSLQQQGTPGIADQLTFNSRLKIQSIDLEGTFSDLRLGKWSLLFSGGVRYAEVEQAYESLLVGNTEQFLISNQEFQGIGPTAAIEVNRPLMGETLSLFGAARLAMLFGEFEHHVEGRNVGLTPPFTLQDQTSSISRQRFVPVIELELGLEYTKPIGGAELVLQGGVVSQLWPVGNGPHGYGNMGLIGANVSAGMRFSSRCRSSNPTQG